ncbi:hypothetical protein KFK09_019913 [Dendrobium nobile]|uniref:Uncharacterized protein n=1 Tax=Dendrobium nobile TaxID=94219 RepID=A0A8T3ARG6_DENNO|nr:hypothetical protein KFK09_019913 [Dendrobium nobile]
MPHQSTLSSFLSIFITALISCNVSTCRAARLLPPMPESPLLPTLEAPPPHHQWPFPRPQWPTTNFPRHEAHPKAARFPPWIQDPTKFEEPKLQPKVPSCHELKPSPKPKWPVPELTPKVEEPTPAKLQAPALPPPLHEMPGLLSPELAPMASVALVPSSAEAKHN